MKTLLLLQSINALLLILYTVWKSVGETHETQSRSNR